MYAFLTANGGTIVVGLMVSLICFSIILKMRREKSKGACAGCGGNCQNCPH